MNTREQSHEGLLNCAWVKSVGYHYWEASVRSALTRDANRVELCSARPQHWLKDFAVSEVSVLCFSIGIQVTQRLCCEDTFNLKCICVVNYNTTKANGKRIHQSMWLTFAICPGGWLVYCESKYWLRRFEACLFTQSKYLCYSLLRLRFVKSYWKMVSIRWQYRRISRNKVSVVFNCHLNMWSIFPILQKMFKHNTELCRLHRHRMSKFIQSIELF